MKSNPRREDIAGARAVSALLVAAFHIWFVGLSGGVDVFFVVAGFFLARSAMRRVEASGAPGVLAIWSQLVGRLAPNLLICLIGVIALAFAILDAPARQIALQHVAASALFVENYYLVGLAGDPATRQAAQQMSEHLWALGVIAQAYLVLPLLFAFAAWRARGEACGARRTVTILLAILCAASFVYGVVATKLDPEKAYYAAVPRLWEFALGALIGLSAIPERPLPRALCVAGSWVGVGALVSCGFLIGAHANFPGVASLWPVSAGALILCFSRTDDAANAGWLLAMAPLQRLGGYSYGFYIWHWPLTLIALNASGWTSLSWELGGAIIVASFLLAAGSQALSKKAMSRPWFATSAVRRGATLAGALLALAAFALAAR